MVATIVLDAGPILQDVPSVSTLLSTNSHIFTTPSVVAEIRDPQARTRLNTVLLPFLKIQSPSSESLRLVSAFAQKTGDLSVLSNTDVELLGLAYDLQIASAEGSRGLRQQPLQRKTSSTSPKKEVPPAQPIEITDNPEISEEHSFSPENVTADDSGNGHQEDSRFEETDEGTQAVDDSYPPLDQLAIDDDQPLQSSGPFAEDPVPSQDPVIPVSTKQEIASDSESDAGGWITPANIKKHQAADQNPSAKSRAGEQSIEVATMTTDFAMQNVLLQIGLNLISPEMKRIRNVRSYILRCHACFLQVKDTSKQFCPRCGKPTLTRVSCSTNAQGQFQIHLKKSMQWNHRGDRYSAPKPVHGSSSGKANNVRGGGQGGWGQELILAEDQKQYQAAIKGQRSRGQAVDVMDQDYLPSILTGERRKGGQRPKVGAGRNVNSKRRS